MFQQYTNTFQHTEPKRPRDDSDGEKVKKKRRLELVQKFIEYFHLTTRPPEDTLVTACMIGNLNLERVKAIIELYGKDIVNKNGKTYDNSYTYTALMAAARYNRLDTCKYLIEECNADVTMIGMYGFSILHWVFRGYKTNVSDIMRYLLQYTPISIINHKDIWGRTPLDWVKNRNSNDNNRIQNKQAIIDLMRSKGALRAQEVDLVQTQGYAAIYPNISVEELKEKYKQEFPNGTPLVVASGKGRMDDVKTFVNAGMDVNEVGEDSDGISFTPLMAAAGCEHTNIVYYLLKRPEINPAVTDEIRNNALHCAAMSNKTDTKTVQLLLDKMTPTDINHKNSDGHTPLDCCYLNKNSIKDQLITLMRSKGALRAVEQLQEKYKQEFPKGTPLVVASEKGRLDDVETFVDAGMDVNQFGKDRDGDLSTPLMAAALYEHFDVVQCLIENGADPTIADGEGENALHLANNNKNTDIVEILLNHMDFHAINGKTSVNSTPLDLAYVSKSPQKQAIIELMKSKGALTSQELDIVTKKGYTALNPNMSVEELKEKYKQEFRDDTAVIHACEKGCLEDVKKLITSDNVNEEDHLGEQSRTPLMAAVEHHHKSIVLYLIYEAGADANVSTGNNENALHIAAESDDDSEFVEILLDHMTLEAITQKKDTGGYTPLECCKEYNESDAVQTIITLIESKIDELTPRAVLGHCYTLEEFRKIKMPEQRLIMNKNRQEDLLDPTAKKIYPVKVQLMPKLATGDEAGETTIYDVNTEAQIHQWEHNGSVCSVCFSPDGSMLATGDRAGKTTIYDVKSKTKIHEWKHKNRVRSVCFSPDASMLATGDGFLGLGKTTIYDLKSKTKIHEWEHKAYVYSVCFSPDGSMLATGDWAYKTTIYDVNTEAQIHQWDHQDSVKSVCFSPDGSMLATGDQAGKTTIYDLESFSKIHEFDHYGRPVRSVCFSPDGSMLATGDEASKTTIYDVNTEAQIHQWDHEDFVNSVCFSPDALMLATGDDYHNSTIYDLKSEAKIHEWDHGNFVNSVCFSPKTWESYNKDSLYVYSAEELQRWLNTNKGYGYYHSKHNTTPSTNQKVYGVQFLTPEEIKNMSQKDQENDQWMNEYEQNKRKNNKNDK